MHYLFKLYGIRTLLNHITRATEWKRVRHQGLILFCYAPNLRDERSILKILTDQLMTSIPIKIILKYSILTTSKNLNSFRKLTPNKHSPTIGIMLLQSSISSVFWFVQQLTLVRSKILKNKKQKKKSGKSLRKWQNQKLMHIKRLDKVMLPC